MIKFYATNLIDQATISASTENQLFPKSNIQHMHRTKVFRSTTNNDSLVFDLGETSAMDSILIVPSSRLGFGFITATLELNATNEWSSPAFSAALTINHVHGLAYAEFTTQNYRFARLVLTSTAGYCEISNLFLGEKIEFDSGAGVEFGWQFQDDELSSTKKNTYGQRFTDVKSRQRKMTLPIRSINKDELDQMFELYDLCGESYPFFMRLGDSSMSNDPERYSGMYFLTQVPSVPNKSFNLYDLNLSVEEAM